MRNTSVHTSSPEPLGLDNTAIEDPAQMDATLTPKSVDNPHMAASVLFVFAVFEGLGFVVWLSFLIFGPKIMKLERVRRELDAQNTPWKYLPETGVVSVSPTRFVDGRGAIYLFANPKKSSDRCLRKKTVVVKKDTALMLLSFDHLHLEQNYLRNLLQASALKTFGHLQSKTFQANPPR